jgi:hypothetical protein
MIFAHVCRDERPSAFAARVANSFEDKTAARLAHEIRGLGHLLLFESFPIVIGSTGTGAGEIVIAIDGPSFIAVKMRAVG